MTAYFEWCVRRQTKVDLDVKEIMSHDVQFKNGNVCVLRRGNVRETRGPTLSCPKGWHVDQEIGSLAGKLFLSKPLRGGCVIECKIEQFNF